MKKILLFSGLAFLVIAALGFFISNKEKSPAVNLEESSDKSSGGVLSDGGTKTGLLPAYTGESIYNLGTDLSVMNNLPKEKLEQQKKFLKELESSLTENPNNFDSWMAVGLHKKFFNNYSGARDAWEYAKLVSSENSLPYLNLANLYAYYLKDLKKAEENFLLAVERDPGNSFGSYHFIANFYRDFGFKEKALTYYKLTLRLNPTDEAVKTEIERLGL